MTAQWVWTTVPCALGVMLVARSARGLAAVRLGDSAANLAAGLTQHRPGATPGPVPEAEAVAQRVSHPAGAWTGPLDLSTGTPFQQRVWQGLRAIGPGETVSYGALAVRLGHPGAARAVARACGANPLAVVIPCHRVVRADGGLGGYRWGRARKEALLSRERLAMAPAPDTAPVATL